MTGYWEGSKAIRLGPKPADAELAWQDGRNLRGLMAQPLYRDGYVYTIDKQHGRTCFELKTGKKLWDDDNTLTPQARNPARQHRLAVPAPTAFWPSTRSANWSWPGSRRRVTTRSPGRRC